MGPKVLVVIGSQTQGLLFKHLLGEQGLDAVCVEAIGPAAAALADGKPAAILVDASSLGADAVAELRRRSDAPILVLGSAALPPLPGVHRADGPDPKTAARQLKGLLAAPAGRALPSEADILRRSRILVVDDSVTYREFLRMELEAEGCQVQVARNADEAEAALGDGGFDCAVLDLIMPGISGIELCGRFHRHRYEHGRYFPILMLTSQESDEQLVACVSAGADSFVGKSRPMEVLKAKLMALLRCKFMVEGRLAPGVQPR